jgi:hypothetical protein
MVHTQRSTRLSEPRHKTCGSWHDRGRRGIVLPQIGSGEGVRFGVCSASGVLEHHGERCGRWSDRRRRLSNQSGEEPANGERNTRRARPEVRATARAVAARFGPLDPLAGDARPRRRSGRACRRRADDGYACASRRRVRVRPRRFLPPGSTFWPMPPPSVPQYHRRQTLGRGSGDGRPERASTALERAESRATPSRVTIQAYRPTGHLRYGKATPDMKHMR